MKVPDDVFGDPFPAPERPKRKRQLTDTDQRGEQQRIDDCLHYPLLYEMAELLPGPSHAGRRREHPSLAHLLLATLMPVLRSKRKAVHSISTEAQWRHLRARVRRMDGRTAAARLPDNPPSRFQFLYAEENLLAPNTEALHGTFERYAIRQALAQGLFPPDGPRNWTRPARNQPLAGDATVAKAPSKAEQAITVDQRTGELRHRRVDPAARIYYENGEVTATPARGTKWFFSSGRDIGYWRRVILGFTHVAGGDAEDEAAIAVRSFADLHSALPGTSDLIPLPVLRLEPASDAPNAAGTTCCASPAAKATTSTASRSASPPPPTTARPPTPPGSGSKATPNAGSIVPNTSSRSRRRPSPTNSPTPGAVTPSPCISSSTPACGTGA
ncbi:hypothetical protein [Kitasatospora sp. Root107]|uniref:hypothetical protein n=1 Tax=Kitasatospora sp. Root107 TaxID=1736424 RepID=UPI0007158789|nr:hypothetical protein [Kitasatospora sp. Root107]KQV13830.1 hypothetical protein ASC99_32955 [Kitasatospora sp. Root107]